MVEWIFSHKDTKMLWNHVPKILEVYHLIIVSEFNVSKSFLFFKWISKVDEKPSIKIVSIINILLPVSVATCLHFVIVCGKV